ncbi:serine protease inhibitor A3B-like [Apodemus sylvaticus]|uniref:serine protease inhibitor A3B-like n=1 Tax=Apodemus sylvaticus TaxID=10129 RepID=UPI002243C197|nr:serine protease inhibitor A3B-like [Apodemus sylvaticus]
MAFIAALGLVMAGICPAVFCFPDGTLGTHTSVQKVQDTRKQSDSQAFINTNFAFSLYKVLALKNPHKNIVFSPFSIETFLASLSLGAKGNTLEEILEGLKFNLTETPETDMHQGFGHLLQSFNQPGDQVQISTGNTLFVEKHLQILTEFKEEARALYQTKAFRVDFQQPREARKLINDYVNNQTQGKIKEVVSDLDRNTSMLMMNFLLYSGQWNVRFDPEDTIMEEFIVDRRRRVMAPMMKIEDLTTPYFRDEELECTVVELSYIGNHKAIFILPDQGKMQQVEASLKPETLRKWRKSLRPRVIDELHLPKFSLSKKYNLEEILPELGIRELFSTQADLSGIIGVKNITVSQMVHSAVLEMTEMGTEAVANTVDKYNTLSAKNNPTFVNIDRKFLYIVLEPSSELICFLGKVINPLEN